MNNNAPNRFQYGLGIAMLTAVLSACGGDPGTGSSTSSTSSSSSSASSSGAGLIELTIQEAEQGFCGVDGTIDANEDGFTGTGFANSDNESGKAVTWSVSVPYDGSYSLEWRYANGSALNRAADVIINGLNTGSVDFTTTGAWNSWTSVTTTVNLNAGENDVRLVANTGEGLANIDFILFVGNELQRGSCSTASSSSSSSGSSSSGTINPYPSKPIGFGENTTGGEGGSEVVVTSGAALRDALNSSGRKVIIVRGTVSGIISTSAKDKTIQGENKNARLTGNLALSGADNVIIKNLHIENPEGIGSADCIELNSGSRNIWVHHVTFGQCDDGALDTKNQSNLITVSWNKFAYTSATHDHNFANLIGHSASNTADRGHLKMTWHHNWYASNVIERMPRVRFGEVHVFNNFYQSNRTNYVIGIGREAQVLLEASYFENQGNKTWFEWDSSGRIQWTDDNVFDNTTMATWAINSDVFDPPYEYRHVLQSAADARQAVIEHAGIQ